MALIKFLNMFLMHEHGFLFPPICCKTFEILTGKKIHIYHLWLFDFMCWCYLILLHFYPLTWSLSEV